MRTRLQHSLVALLCGTSFVPAVQAQIVNGLAHYNATLERNNNYSLCAGLGCANSFQISTLSPTPSQEIKTLTQGWMGKLDGSLLLSQISIPGTHDAGAERPEVIFAPTQSWSIDKQLDAGIRWFDLRVRENDNGHQACSGNQHAGHTWDIYHGSTDLDLTFDQVLVWMNSFLSNNPTEAIICWIQTSEPGVNPEFSEVLDQYVTTNARIFYPTSALASAPSLSSVQGKIYLLNNVRGDGATLSINWQNFYQVNPAFPGNVYGLDDDGEGFASVSGKIRAIKEYIDAARTSSHWTVNHLSGVYPVVYPPELCASEMNYQTFHYLNEIPGRTNVGTILMDYPGEGLIYRIIKTNFCFTKRVDYSAKLDCGGEAFGYSADDITVKFYSGLSLLGSDTRDGLGCEIDKGYNLENAIVYSTKNELDITRVTMETDGSDDLFIDRLRLAKKNYSRDADAENGCDNCAPDDVVYEWGEDGGSGWCLSHDPSGFGLSCSSLITFDVSLPLGTPCQDFCSTYLTLYQDLSHGTGTVASGTFYGNTITSAGSVPSGSTVIYEGYNTVRLIPGFRAYLGSAHISKIQGCP